MFSETDLSAATSIETFIREIFAHFDWVAYALLQAMYQLFFNVASVDLFGNDTIMKFYGRVQVILGVFMMFQLALTILKGIVNPDSFFGDKGSGKAIITKIITALLLLTVIMPISIPNPRNEYEIQINNNGLLFGTLYSLQHRILSANTIGRIVLGTNSSNSFSDRASNSNDTELKRSSRIFAATILKGFYRINLLPEENRPVEPKPGEDPAIYNDNRVCTDIDDDVLDAYTKIDASPGDIIFIVNETCTPDGNIFDNLPLIGDLRGNKRYAFTMMPIVSTIVAIIFVFILLSFCVDIGVRAVKLAVLRLIAPIPIISYMDPKGSKDGAFNSWVKALTTTYIDLFIRLAIVYFVIFLIQSIIQNGIVMNDFDGNIIIVFFTYILIFIALFVFAKQAPKFIKEVLGIKNDSMGNIFGRAFGMAALTGGMIGSAKTGYRTAKEENEALHPGATITNTFRNVGSGIAGAIGGGYAGAKALEGKDASVQSVLQAQSQANALRASHSTLPGRIASDMYGMVNGRSLATLDQATLDANKAAASSLKTFKASAVDEAMKKGTYGTVSNARGTTHGLTGKGFNKRQLEQAMLAKNDRGEFTVSYTDVATGMQQTGTFNVAWFDANVMAEIEDTQTATYLRSDYDVATHSFRNSKINSDWRAARHDVHEAGIKYRGDYIGDIAAGGDQNSGDYAYSDIGRSIGDANANVADMSTNMRNIMHRANSRGKK